MHSGSSGEASSIVPTPPRLYQPASTESVVRDFAYDNTRHAKARSLTSLAAKQSFGAAADFYGDHGESVTNQPGVRKSIEKPLPDLPVEPVKTSKRGLGLERRDVQVDAAQKRRFTKGDMLELEHSPTTTVPRSAPADDVASDAVRHNHKRERHYHPHVSDFFESSYYRHPVHDRAEAARKLSSVTDTRSVARAPPTSSTSPPIRLCEQRTLKPAAAGAADADDAVDAKYGLRLVTLPAPPSCRRMI